MSKKKEFGVCHICGQYGELTYEHIPPQSTFTSTRRKLCTIDTLLCAPSSDNRPPWDQTGLRYKQFQSGVGFNTLCGKCNSFTGSKYGVEFAKVVQGIGYEILKIPPDERKGIITFTIQDINVLAFFKQVISMFCSVNNPQFGERFRNFLLDENSTDFDSTQYRVFTYLHSGKVVRYVPLQGHADIKNGGFVLFSEISAFPLGFILYILTEKTAENFRGCDITLFSAQNNLRAVKMPIPFLKCNTPFGLDFRYL